MNINLVLRTVQAKIIKKGGDKECHVQFVKVKRLSSARNAKGKVVKSKVWERITSALIVEGPERLNATALNLIMKDERPHSPLPNSKAEITDD